MSKNVERRKDEDILWRHKSRFQWLREGERNTRFFHKEMIQHRKHNRIFSMLDLGGNMVLKHEDTKNLMVNRFQTMLSNSNPDRFEEIDQITHHIPQLVNRY